MSYSESITREDLANILNAVLPPTDYSKVVETQTITALNKTWTFRRIGNIVFIDASGDMSGTVGAGFINIGVLSETLRPKYNVYLKCNNSTADIRLYVYPSGTVTFYHPSQTTGAQNCGFSGYAWIVGDGQASPPPRADCADYVVEQGTSGIWTYRKWNSSIAECWGSTSVPSATYSANGGYKNITESLPSGLFNATPTVVLASGRINTLIQTMVGFTAPNNATSVQTYLINRGASAVTQTGSVFWQVKGTWK